MELTDLTAGKRNGYFTSKLSTNHAEFFSRMIYIGLFRQKLSYYFKALLDFSNKIGNWQENLSLSVQMMSSNTYVIPFQIKGNFLARDMLKWGILKEFWLTVKLISCPEEKQGEKKYWLLFSAQLIIWLFYMGLLWRCSAQGRKKLWEMMICTHH